MASKNKGGRPPRAKGEKLQRINLTLRPSVLFGLEIVAKHRRISLSQATEYLIEQAIRSYEIEGTAVIKFLEISAKAFAASDKRVKEGALDVGDVEDAYVKALLASEPGRILLTPRSLLAPTEEFFQDTYFEAMRRRDSAVYALMDADTLALCYEIARESEREGRMMEYTVKDMIAVVRERHPAPPDSRRR